MLAQWIVFYSDGFATSSFSSLDGEPKDAPGFDVQLISMVDPNIGWHIQSMSDYYGWDDRGSGYRWWGMDLMGLGDYLNKRGQWQKILKGTTITSETFNSILVMARSDPRLPKKVSYTRKERKWLGM